MLDRAERAATAGDLASADELLTGAAELQEKELGPHHPDLANTLNNLAIVAERTGRPAEAERLYRRAAAIAAAAFPPDHPMVVASTQNLEDFCRARGLPIKLPPAIPSPPRADPSTAAAAERPPAVANTPTVVRPLETAVSAPPAPPPPAPPSHDPGAPTATPSEPLTPARTPARASRSFAWIATGGIILVAAVLLMLRPGSSGDPSTSAPTQASAPEPASVPPAEAAPPPDSAPAVSRAPVRPPKAAPRPSEKGAGTTRPSGAHPVTLATAQLCSTFSTRGGAWRCTPVGTSVRPGPIVFYTRVRSARNAAVVHRWYRGRTLRQSVRLTTRASATEGYRTYSRQTVNQGDWTVEARTADGTLLHEQKFAVR